MDRFEEILLKHQNSRFLVIDSMGGKGDKPICKGMEKKLKELGISFTTFRHKCEQSRLFEIRNLVRAKDTFLYPNFYHKNKGVYEFSLYKFPNVKFIDSPRFERALVWNGDEK